MDEGKYYDLVIEEYRTLRTEILARINLCTKIESSAIVGMAVVWTLGWRFLSRSNSTATSYQLQLDASAIWIEPIAMQSSTTPAPLSFLCIAAIAYLFILASASFVAFETAQIFKIGGYIATQIEAKSGGALNWENHYGIQAVESECTGFRWQRWQICRHAAYYILLCILNVVVCAIALKLTRNIDATFSLISLVIISLTIRYPLRIIKGATEARQQTAARMLETGK